MKPTVPRSMSPKPCVIWPQSNGSARRADSGIPLQTTYGYLPDGCLFKPDSRIFVTDLSSPPVICEELTDQAPGDPLEKRVSADVRIWSFFGLLVPVPGLAAAVFLLWGHGCNWTQLSLMLAMYIVTGIGVTVGFHRLFTHRAFETVPIVRAILIVMGSMSVEGNLLTWVVQHRQHHQFPDREGDPH